MGLQQQAFTCRVIFIFVKPATSSAGINYVSMLKMEGSTLNPVQVIKFSQSTLQHVTEFIKIHF